MSLNFKSTWILVGSLAAASACAGGPEPELGEVESAVTFPTTWFPILQGGQGIGDVETDGGNGSREIVGNAANPAIYVATDGTSLFVRFRLDENPIANGGGFPLQQFGWGLLIDTDGNLASYEYVVAVNGVTDTIVFSQNTTPTGGPLDDAETLLFSGPATLTIPAGAGDTIALSIANTSFAGTQDFFLDVSIPLHTAANTGFADKLGLDRPLRFVGGSSNNGTSLSLDLAGVTGDGTLAQASSDPMLPDGSTADRDGDGIADGTDLDDDNDGIADTRETSLGIDPSADVDGDGIANWRDVDNRGDGMPAGCVDANTNGVCDAPIAAFDTDGDGVPNHLDLDTDNDGVPDVIEAGHSGADANGDGMVDGPYGADGYADSLSTYPLLDTDGDGAPDFRDLDSDGDSAFDVFESGNGGLDANNDGKVDGGVGADHDGIVDAVDADDARFGFPGIARDDLTDTDLDGIPDPYDPVNALGGGDSDGDGLLDALECVLGWVCPDSNSDGRPNYMVSDNLDTDGDGIRDGSDNCPLDINPGQADADMDGIGDACDNDADNDGIPNATDNCPSVANASQANNDGDAMGDACDPDDDNDGVVDGNDNCPFDMNPAQTNSDTDALGDACDPDDDNDGALDPADSDDMNPSVCSDVDGDTCEDCSSSTFAPLNDGTDTNGDGLCDAADPDGDGVVGSADNCPTQLNPLQTNSDGDTLGDACDNCPLVDNQTQADADTDGLGDACDPDLDNDGILNGADNCPTVANTPQTNSDTDGLGDACDPDDDNDGVVDGGDNCPVVANAAQTNSDTDALGDACDPDDDNDNVLDGVDNCPLVANQNQTDTNMDGTGDACENDRDGDGIPDGSDNCPDVANPAQTNSDTDAEGDACDTDDDNDGVVDSSDTCALIANADQRDTDMDGMGDVCDADADGDTISNADEGAGDSDGDGTPDFLDLDSDNDHISDADEAGDDDLSTPPVDTDGDGTPDYHDLDTDGDGFPDADEAGDGDLGTPPVDTDDDDLPDFRDLDADGDGLDDRLGVEGGGCSTTGSSSGAASLLLVGMMVAFAGRRRRRSGRVLAATAAAAALIVVAGARPVAAQSAGEHRDFSVERFRWTFARTGLLGAEWADVPRHLSFDLGLWLGTADDPLTVYQVQNSDRMRVGSLVAQRTSANLVASIALWNRLEVGLDVPLILSQESGSVAGIGMLESISGAGLGDLRIAPKIGLLRAVKHGVDLSITPAFTLPTGSAEDYRGEDGPTFAPELGLSRRSGRLRGALNLGYRFRKESQLADLIVDDEVFAEVATGVRVASPVELAVGVSAATGANDLFGNSNRNHLELQGGATFDVPGPLLVTAIVGAGLDQGFGTPDWRAVLGVRFGKVSEQETNGDRDRDGIADAKDRCVTEPEDKDAFEDSDGCPDPDNDKDRVLDTADGAPLDPEDDDGFQDEDGVPDPDNDGDGLADGVDKCPLEPETKNGFADDDGCPDEGDRDGDGILDDADKCPDEREDADTFEDGDGCPDPDNDKDGVVDAQDRCPLVVGVADNAGCPDEDRDADTVVDRLDNCPDKKGLPKFQGCPDKQLVVLTGDKLEILDIVYFALDKAAIQTRSNKLLDQVAKVLAAHPEITSIEVEGHTDNQGKPEHNRELSQKRADAVVAFLVKKGVAADRLKAHGYGADRPIDDNGTKAGRAKNRRVEFKIVGAPWINIVPTGPGAETMEK